MKKNSIRQKNYRRRKKLMQEIRFAYEMQKTYPESTLKDLYKKLFEEIYELEDNKGDFHVQKWQKTK